MKPIKYLFIGILFLVSCTGEKITGRSTETETGQLAGGLVLKDGENAEGAIVTLTSAGNLAKNSAAKNVTAQTNEVEADQDGRYLFENIENGLYNLSAVLVKESDTLVAYRFNVEFENSLFVGVDTMFTPGKVLVAVSLNDKPVSEIDCYIPGTSFISISDKNGNCTISSIEPGIYEIAFRHQTYIADPIQNIEIQPGSIIELQKVNLKADPKKPPPVPLDLVVEYSDSTGIVSLSWDNVVVSDLAGYILYKDTLGSPNQTRVNEGYLITEPFYNDTILRAGNEPGKKTIQYRIKSQDEDGNTSIFKAFDTITVFIPPPNPKGLEIQLNDSTKVVNLFWDNLNIPSTSGYLIHREEIGPEPLTNFDLEILIHGTAFSDSLMIPDSIFKNILLQYKLRAIDSNGLQSNWVLFTEIELKTPPPAPREVYLNHKDSSNFITISWDRVDVPDFQSYKIFRHVMGTKVHSLIYQTSSNGDTAFVDTLQSNMFSMTYPGIAYNIQTIDEDKNSSSPGISDTISVDISHLFTPMDPSKQLAHWDFEPLETSTVLNDLSPNHAQGEISGNTQWSKGIFDNALSFDGQSTSILFPFDSLFDIDSGTVMAWIHPNACNAVENYCGIVVKSWAFGIFLWSSNMELVAYDWNFLKTTGNDGIIRSGQSVLPKQWSHVAMTFNSTEPDGLKIYLNGSLVHTSSFDVAHHNHPLTIGSSIYGESHPSQIIEQKFEGKIDEVYIYNRVLDSTEIKLEYHNFRPKNI